MWHFGAMPRIFPRFGRFWLFQFTWWSGLYFKACQELRFNLQCKYVVGPPCNENLKLESCNWTFNLHIPKKLAAHSEFFLRWGKNPSPGIRARASGIRYCFEGRSTLYWNWESKNNFYAVSCYLGGVRNYDLLNYNLTKGCQVSY